VQLRKGLAHCIAQAAPLRPAVARVVTEFDLKRLCTFRGIAKVHVAVLLARIWTSTMHLLHLVWQCEECAASFEAGSTRRPQCWHLHHKKAVAPEGSKSRAVSMSCDDVVAVYAHWHPGFSCAIHGTIGCASPGASWPHHAWCQEMPSVGCGLIMVARKRENGKRRQPFTLISPEEGMKTGTNFTAPFTASLPTHTLVRPATEASRPVWSAAR